MKSEMAYDPDEALRTNRNRSWWQQRTNMERRGIILLIIAIIIIIGLIIGIALAKKNNKTDGNQAENENRSVCQTRGCVNAATQLLKNMDETVNPCDDFYQFACGSYRKETEIPEDKSEINAFHSINDAVQKQLKVIFEEPVKSHEPKPFTLIKKLYRNCMNTTAIEKNGLTVIKELFRNAGGWPVLEGNNWNEAEFEWKKFMQKLRMLEMNTDSFINLGVGIDPTNSTKRIILLDQGSLNVVKANLLGGFQDELVIAYYNYLVDLAVFFGADRRVAEYDVRNLVNFKIELAKISLSDDERRDAVALNHIISITELQSTYPGVPWLDFINSIIGRADKSITNASETVNVLAPRYFGSLVDLLNRTPKRAQANYALFQSVYSLVDYLPDNIRTRKDQFKAVYLGNLVREPRWKECTGVTSQALNLAVGALYVRNYFQEDAKKNAEEMALDIQNALVDLIQHLDWMDEATKKTAIDKAKSIALKIGYAKELLDDKKLEDHYAELSFSDTYVKAMLEYQAFSMNNGLNTLRDPIDKDDWTQRMQSFDINAQYSPQENSIEVPAGILQGVFFNKDRPQYMNYGGIAYIIGHEFTHGFDDTGRRFDKEGNLVNWWAEQTDTSFKEKAKCIIDQYSAITVPEVGMKLKGENTKDENIADNGGIKEAYMAYNTWVERNGVEPILPGLNYTVKQLFWISAANCWCSKERKQSLSNDIDGEEHSPNRYRVLVPFSNTEYFAKDFNCPLESAMNQKNKCHVW